MKTLLEAHPFFADKTIDSCRLLPKQGYCNENYLVVAEGRKYVVRKLIRGDIDRELEWRVQNLAYQAEIAAAPLLFDRENGLMVFEFLEGIHKTRLDDNALKSLAQTLQKLHSIKIDAPPLELEIESSIVDAYPKEYVLCHNDLNPNNILFSEDIKLIDWEYAGVNDRYFDLASVCVEFRLSAEMQEVFLEAYFEGGYSLEKLERYKEIYRALCEKWFVQNV